MKWFKHFSKAKYDIRIKRLINKYGLEGYGLYFLIVESIAFQLETENPIPDLEETAQDIAEFANGDTIRIQEIIEYCLEQKLFEYNHDTGRIMCLKILTHLDNTMSNNPEIRNIIDNFKKLQETSSSLNQIKLDQLRLDKNKTKEEKNKKPSLLEIKEYISKMNYKYVNADTFYNFYESKNWYVGKNKMSSWHKAIAGWESRENKKEKDKNPYRPI